jgi:Fic family protein
MSQPFQLISSDYLTEYTNQAKVDWAQVLTRFSIKEKITPEDFEYYLIASSLYSSKIEGNTLDVNSFFRNRGKEESPKKREVEEIEDLVAAYQFAVGNKLTKDNLLKAHGILSTPLLPVKERGVIRKDAMWIRDSKTLKPVYVAVEPEFVESEINKFFSDVSELLERKLEQKEVFYYASMMHLWMAMIHPFGDGNGRAARLLEKWFLASKLGRVAWSVNSEKYYWDNRPAYYQNIALGYNYYSLHWERCIPFLLMLTEALEISNP